MIRALPVALLMLFLAGSVVAGNLASPMEEPQGVAAATTAGECSEGLGSGSCNATCAACVTFAANAVESFAPPDFDRLQFAPASRLTDASCAPDAAPPKHLRA